MKPVCVQISISVLYLPLLDRYMAIYPSDSKLSDDPAKSLGVAGVGRTPWKAIRKMTACAMREFDSNPSAEKGLKP